MKASAMPAIRRIASLLLTACGAVLWATAACAAQGDAGAVIVEAVWTDTIQQDNQYRTIISKDPYRGETLYAWFLIQGGGQALEMIRREKKLPVRLQWYTIDRQEIILSSTKDISLTDEEIAGLETEFDNTNQTSWNFRIWDYRTAKGYWKIIPVYGVDSLVPMQRGGGTCEMDIHFKR
jgi:hypothetical protein